MTRKLLATALIAALAITAMMGCRKKEHGLEAGGTPGGENVPSAKDDFPTQTPIADAEPRPGVDEEWLKLCDKVQSQLTPVYFDFDKYNLKPEAREALAKNAEVLKANPGISVFVEGHCDERGTNEYNLALGERRANAAKSYEVQSGVGAAAMFLISYGEEKPRCVEHAESCWWQNRRCDFTVRRDMRQ